MRIRKLATDLGTDDVALLELLRSLGHGRYTDVEQQLPASIEAQVRRHARDLPKAAPPTVLPTPRARPVAPSEPERTLFEQAMAGVRPLGAAPPKPKPARPAPPAPAPVRAGPVPPGPVSPGPVPYGAPVASPPASAKGPPASAKAPAAAVPAGISPGTRPVPAKLVPSPGPRAEPTRPVDIGTRVRMLEAEEQLVELRARLEAVDGARAAAEARAVAAEASRESVQARLDALEIAYGEVDQHRRQLQRAASEASLPEPATLRVVFERRGLRGEDEMGAALRALVDAHRAGELLRLEVADPAAAEELLWERILLLGEDEAAPAGVVAVRVPSERSEGPGSSVNRLAMSRFSTTCLVNNRKRIVIVGGSPAYHRILKEGLDPRLDVRLIPGNRRGRLPEIPSADLVIIWASTILDHSVSAQYPAGVVIPHRSIARMLATATEWIERR